METFGANALSDGCNVLLNFFTADPRDCLSDGGKSFKQHALVPHIQVATSVRIPIGADAANAPS
jgi:hypothetical protein